VSRQASCGLIRSCVIALVVSVASLAILSAATAASTSGPMVAGVWTVYEPKGGVGDTPVTDTYTFTKTAANTYTITNAEGFTALNVAISSGGSGASATACWTAPASATCAKNGHGYGLQTFTFDFGSCPATFASKYQAYSPSGATVYGEVDGDGTKTNTRCSKKVLISGTLRQRRCEIVPNTNRCHLLVVPWSGQAVELSGAHGDHVTKSSKDGVYRFLVKRGRYAVRVSDPHGRVEPTSRSFAATANVGNQDFTYCKEPAEAAPGDYGCDLVEVEGSVVDVKGQPYSGGLVAVARGVIKGYPGSTEEGDQTFTDSSGHFVLFAARGTVTVVATGDTPAAPEDQVTVNASLAVNTAATLKLVPGVTVGSGPDRLTVNVGQLPKNAAMPHYDFTIKPIQVDLGALGFCRRTETVPFTIGEDSDGGHNANFRVFPERNGKGFSSFCLGTYTGVVTNNAGSPVVSTDFTIERER